MIETTINYSDVINPGALENQLSNLVANIGSEISFFYPSQRFSFTDSEGNTRELIVGPGSLVVRVSHNSEREIDASVAFWARVKDAETVSDPTAVRVRL